ncbi:MAG: HesA/MoeB/ThiF family protein [Thaumarchaeota archaeon]|nr:HesA/MoeB/ThiF family protein [Nitrososphaerota archaeon]
MGFDDRFFARQVALDGFGRGRQRSLAESHAVVAGLGGTGSVMAVNLAIAGVGRLTLIDRDVVSAENLHRQPVYALADVGVSKAEVAAEFLRLRVPGLRVEYRAVNLERANASRLIREADIAVDCLDNFAGRYALNAACVARKIPFVHTGAMGWEASAGVFWSPKTACFECVFPDSRDEDVPSCEEVGVLGALTSYIASAGALETVKVLSGMNSGLLGAMLIFDGLRMESHSVPFETRAGCGTCGDGPHDLRRKNVVELCGGNELFISRAFPSRDFGRIAKRLDGRARRMGDSIVMARVGGLEVSIFRSGGILVKGASSPRDIQSVARALGLSFKD